MSYSKNQPVKRYKPFFAKNLSFFEIFRILDPKNEFFLKCQKLLKRFQNTFFGSFHDKKHGNSHLIITSSNLRHRPSIKQQQQVTCNELSTMNMYEKNRVCMLNERTPNNHVIPSSGRVSSMARRASLDKRCHL